MAHGIKGSTLLCEREGCPNKVIARGLCGMHYARWRKTGDPGPAGRHRKVNPPECTVPGCPEVPKGHGLCEMHWARQRRTGDPGPAGKRKPRGSCQAPNCGKPHQAKGLCDSHYRRTRPERVRPQWAEGREPTRTCGECERALPLSEFYWDKRGGYRRSCKDCHKADVTARFWANPDPVRAYQTRYRADPERRRLDRERAARYRAENPERTRAALAAYRSRPENQERQRQRLRAWRLANPERHREHNRRRLALMRQFRNGASIPTELLDAKLAYWGYRCWIAGPNCRVEPDQWDHVKPLSKGGPHLLANLRPACNPCNSSKRARWPYPLTYVPARVAAC